MSKRAKIVKRWQALLHSDRRHAVGTVGRHVPQALSSPWPGLEQLETRVMLSGTTTLADLPLTAQNAISSAIGQDQSAYYVASTAAGVSLANPANSFTAQVQSGALQVSAGPDTWGMSLAGLDYGGVVQPVGTAQTSVSSNRVDLNYGPIDEWYVNGPGGLEQGFTVSPLPQSQATGSLTLELILGGDLTGTVNAAGDGLTLSRPDGSAALGYTGLVAYDATGKALPASLEVQTESGHQELLIQVIDAGAQGAITIDPFVQQAKLTASDGGANSAFGYSVSISGTTMVVGAEGGAYVFTEPVSGWGSEPNMTQTAKLPLDAAAATSGSLISVSISGNAVVVGADGATVGGNFEQGAAYVFTQSGSNWIQAAELNPSDGVPYNFFGTSVSISGNTVVVGSRQPTVAGSSSGPGEAYVFNEPASGWGSETNMTETSKLIASDGAVGDAFGDSVSISGNAVVVGAPAHTETDYWGEYSPGPGAAYLFTEPASGWGSETNITQSSELTASDGAAGDQFGGAVAISGNTVVVGALGSTVNGQTGPGAGYVFTEPASGWGSETNMTQNAKLAASDGADANVFGNSVSISGNTVVVGAELATVGGNGAQGAAYVFTEPYLGWDSDPNMTQTAKLTASDGAADDEFGYAVSISGDTVVAGAYGANVGGVFQEGAAYVFHNFMLVVAPPGNQVAIGGQSNSFSLGSFTESSPAAPFSVDVNWGDGSADTKFSQPTVGTILAQNHAFTASGSDMVSITVTDSTGQTSNVATFGVAVAASTTSILVTPPANQAATAGQNTPLALGSFITQTSVTAPFSVDVQWGDNSSDTIFSVSVSGTIPTTPHTYANPGTFAVTLTVTDSEHQVSNPSIFAVNVALHSALPLTSIYSFYEEGLPYGITADSSGNLYGTTSAGGVDQDGTVWELAKGSHTFTALYSFTGGVNGETPKYITMDGSGNLYGLASGGPGGYGLVWELAKSNNTVTALYNFNYDFNAIGGLNGYLVVDGTGNLFGTIDSGGANGYGKVWELAKNGGNFTLTTLYSFTGGANGTGPDGLAMDSAGNLFGTTESVQNGGYGTVWELGKNGSIYTFATLYSFAGGANGTGPYGLSIDSVGDLYGTTGKGGTDGYGLLWELAKNGSTFKFTALYSPTDGVYPEAFATIAADGSGNLYGTSTGGYGQYNQDDGYGTVWELAKGSSTLTMLYSFSSGYEMSPYGITVDGGGNLYGTSDVGGADDNGLVWELANGNGAFTAYSYANGGKGYDPAGIIMDSAGNLYGTAISGATLDGLASQGTDRFGSVWELAKGSSTFNTLYSFTDGADGAGSIGIAVDANGNLYGATAWGGAHGDGTVWELAKNGSTFKFATLYSFTTAGHWGGVAVDSVGNLYGTAEFGGAGFGSVWELAKTGSSFTLTTLYSFTGGADGYGAIDLTINGGGNLYGVAVSGGADGNGTVWELAKGSSAVATLYSFTGSDADGDSPYAITIDGNGYLYGTEDQIETVFKLPAPATPTNPNTPTNIFPSNEATGVSLTPTLEASTFNENGESQAAAEWVVTPVPVSDDVPGAPVFDSGTDTHDLSTCPVPSGYLTSGTTYSWQVRYEDAAGQWSSYSTATIFTTFAPTVTNLAVNKTLLADRDVGTGTFTVTATYSEAMNTSVNPTITFTPLDSTTLALASGMWTDSTDYQANYNVADAGVTVASIGIGVTGAQDAAGNTQMAYSGSNNFSIDTQNPTAVIGAVSPDPRPTPVDSVVITFNEAVTGLALTNFGLTWNGATVELTGATLTPGTGYSYTLGNLTGLTGANGAYSLSMNLAGVEDAAGNVGSGTVNRTWQINVPVAGPDLTVSLGSVGPVLSAYVPGDHITLPVKVTNIGNRPAVGTKAAPIIVEIRASADTTFDSGADPLLARLTYPASIVAGQTIIRSASFVLPSTVAPGSIYAVAAVDTTNVVSELSEDNNTAATASTMAVAWQFGNIPGRTGIVPLTFNDLDGTKVTLRLAGPGVGTLSLDSGNFAVRLLNTTLASTFTITTLKTTASGDNGRFTLDDLTVGNPADAADHTALGTLTALTTDLGGSIDIAGPMTTLKLGNVADQHTITIGTPAPGSVTTPAVALTLGSVRDLTLQSAIRISSLTAVDWQDTDSTPDDSITAPSLGALKITADTAHGLAGDFDASLQLTAANGGSATVPTLNTVSIKGSVPATTWDVNGAIGSMTVGGNAFTLIDASGNIGMLSLTNATAISTLNINANAITTLNVQGSLTNSHITLSQPVSATKQALAKLTVGKTLDNSQIRTSGNIGTVQVGVIYHSLVFAGVLVGVSGRPAVPGDFVNLDPTLLPSIQTFRVTGLGVAATVPVFIDSDVAAGSIVTVVLPTRTTAIGDPDDTQSFGFATRKAAVTHYTGPPSSGNYISGTDSLVT